MIILRFSDYEADTIAEHENVISMGGYVWWGWWKKRHETAELPSERKLRARIERDGVVEVGLLERADSRFYVAKCLEIRTGLESPAPDDRVPSYYSDKRCHAWFKLNDIVELDSKEWAAKFGSPPVGDSTVFPAQRPKPEVETVVVEASGKPGQSGILHISDLHFGSDHGYKSNGDSIGIEKSLLDRIVGGLEFEPVCLVVSGDLTTRGQADGLTSARIFIEKLAERLDLDRNAVVIAPGNHDIPIDDPEVTRDFSNEQPFRDLLQLFYGSELPNERIHDIRDSSGHHLVIGVVNSSRPRRRESMNYGYVGEDRSGPVLKSIRKIAAHPASRSWSALVMHHHVVPAPMFEEPERDRPVSLSLDAGELVSLAQENEVDAILHGHQHLPFVAGITRYAECAPSGVEVRRAQRVLVLGAGSTGVATGDRLPEELNLNSYSTYRPFHQGSNEVHVRCVGFNRKIEPKSLWEFLV